MRPTEQVKELSAMEQLIQYMRECQEYNFISDVEYIIDKATELLTVERKQIIDAVKYGFNDARKPVYDLTFDQYFTKTFKQP